MKQMAEGIKNSSVRAKPGEQRMGPSGSLPPHTGGWESAGLALMSAAHLVKVREIMEAQHRGSGSHSSGSSVQTDSIEIGIKHLH